MTRRIIVGAVGALFVALGLAATAWQVSRASCIVLGGDVTCRVETRAPLVALTFDDGPTELGVDAVLPVLQRHGATATFFLIGEQVERRPDLARRIAGAGHEIANHSWSHRQMVGRLSGWYDRELARTQAALANAGGGSNRLFRPPYGKKLLGLPRAVSRAGLTMVTWDFEEPDATDAAAYAREVVRQARPGSIIIMHPMYRSNGAAREALPLILEGLEAKGLRAVSASQLMASAQPPP
jgi:peptidoglycan/xylan/chitin deacetylase (PgdA/CDA1 family)